MSRNTHPSGNSLRSRRGADRPSRKGGGGPISDRAPHPSHNPHPVLTVDESGRVFYANAAGVEWLARWQVKPGEMAPAPLLELAGEARKRGASLTAEVAIHDRVLSLAAVPESGSARIILYGHDITALKRTESDLRLSNDKFKYVFDHSPIGKSLTLPSGEIAVNEAFCRMLGYSAEELAHRKWQDLTPDEDIPLTEAVLDEVISGRKDRVRFRKRYRRKEGSVIWADVNTALRRDDQGRPLYFMTAVIDITDRVRAEEEIRQLNADLEHRIADRTAQLKEANRELEAFSYSVSHDLRAPLRAIDGFSAALVEDFGRAIPAEAKAYLDRIRAGAGRMAELIEALLHLSRVTRAEIVRERVDLSVMAQDVIRRLEKSDPGRRVDARVEPGLEAEGDSRLLRSVLENLLDNAWKFTAKTAAPRVEFGSGRDPEGRTGFFVRDNGAGFDMAYADKLFVAFQRLHSVEEFPGTGVGLVTVQRIIHRHGGRVWAEGRVGEGATFHFSIG